MKVSGKFLVRKSGAYAFLIAAIALGVWTMSNGADANVDTADTFYEDSAVIPDDAVYLGTDMGGYFVMLRREDITLAGGKTVPAFDIEMYHAWANNRNYGEERVGDLAYQGPALWVPSEKMLEEAKGASIAPPSVEQILINDGRWVNFNVLYVRMKPAHDDPENDYVARIVPM